MADQTRGLIPFDKRTPEDCKKIRRAGQKASVKARKKNMSLQALGQIISELSPKEEDINMLREEFPLLGEEHINNKTILLAALHKEGRKGNVRAFEVFRDTIGEKPEETLNVTSVELDTKKALEMAKELRSSKKKKANAKPK